MKTVSARVSDEEYDRFKNIASDHNLSVSALIKMSFNSSEIRDPALEKSINAQIKKIGINLNQIAHRCNIKKAVGQQTADSLILIEEQMNEILKRLYDDE